MGIDTYWEGYNGKIGDGRIEGGKFTGQKRIDIGGDYGSRG
jgi:hypothetical protein